MEDEELLSLHAKHNGVLAISPEFGVHNKKELGEAYTPGVAVISKLIERYPELKDKYTMSGKLVALVTDGRFSGATEGACIGYVSPEAALRGPLLAIKDGDIIEYDIPARRISVKLTPEEMQERLENAELNVKYRKGWLGIYQRTVGSLAKGAVLSGEEK